MDKKIMSPTEFEHVLIQAAPKAKEVCLHLMGEPLAHPQFPQILSLCEKYKVKIQLTTNGLLLNKFKSLLLKSSSTRQVNFSLQAFKDNFPDRSLDTYLLPLLKFTEEANYDRPDLYINFRLWNQDSTDSDNEEIFKYIETHLNISINRNIEVGAIKSKRIWNKLYLHFDSRFEWPSLDLPFQSKSGRCNGLVKHIAIHSNGDVSPCCLDKEALINLGNAHKMDLGDILESDRAKTMRDGFLNNKLQEELCQKCSYINRFKK
jgi:radical SAM protein with 4Fe4S-binding SPASM domain